MDLAYARTTTATGSSFGTYSGQLSTVSVWTWDPGASVMAATPVAAYAYDASGRLRQVNDPRIVAAGAPALVTAYDYDSTGRLIAATAPGDAPSGSFTGPVGRPRPVRATGSIPAAAGC